jgi:hypothetical protein
MKPTRLVLASLLLVAAAPAPAYAQRTPAIIEQDRAASDRADELFRSGNALAKKDRWAEAEPLFRQAWGLKHSYDIGGNLGIAEAALGRARDAAEHLTFALRTFPANGKAAHRLLLEQTLAKVRGEVAAVTVRVNVDKAEVFVDGKSVGLAPIAEVVFVEAGTHTVEGRLAGYAGDSRVVEATKGGAAEVALVLREVVAPPVVPVVERRPVWPAVVTGVLAVGGLAAGAGLTVAANGKGADAGALRVQYGGKAVCGATSTGTVAMDCKTLKDTGVAQSMRANAAVGSFIAGGVFTLAAAGLGAWAASGRKDPGTKRDGTELRVVPMAGAHEGGVVVLGRW